MTLRQWTSLCGIVACALLFCSDASGQPLAKGRDDKVPFPFQEAPPKKDWEWDEDERFDELMEQLAINEASLDTVRYAMSKKIRRKSSQSATALRLEENNRLMDRKGGAPMKWDEFYGMNAEKFFYHPIDPNTTYRTDTLLRQMGKYEDDKSGEDTPSRQSLPVHQRPPQFDYIYRANRTARENALADAALLEGEVEQLAQRRTQLEQEQAVLWCKLAFRAIQRLNMARKPMLRFEVVSASGDTADPDRAKALAAAARFLANALAVVEKAEQDQATAFGGVAHVVTSARESLEDSLLEVPSVESDVEGTTSDLGKFCKLSQMLADKAKTLTESYAGAMDGDINKDVARKDRFRGMLQDSVIDYAQILVALNELTDKMKTDWKVRVDTKAKLPLLQVAWEPVSSDGGPRTLDSLIETTDKDVQQTGTKADIIDQKALRKAFAAAKAAYDQKTGVLTLMYDFMRAEQRQDWELTDTPIANATSLRGIRISPEDTVTHRASFVEGTCATQFAIALESYRGSVVSAGADVLVTQHPWNGRVFKVCDREVSFAPRNATAFQLVLTVGNGRTYLKANAAEVAVKKSPTGPFQFALHGGENGNEFGAVVISGKPDPTWFQEALTAR